MIETMLRAGSTLNWAWPTELATIGDGAIVTSTLLPPPMQYTGTTGGAINWLAGQFSSPFAGTLVNYRWLCYQPGRTHRLPLAGGADIVTGEMSGCPLIIMRHTVNGVREPYVFHVGTASANIAVNNAAKLPMRNLVTQAPPGEMPMAFDAEGAWPGADMLKVGSMFGAGSTSVRVFAIFTSAFKCFSMLTATPSHSKSPLVVYGVIPVPSQNPMGML